MLIQNTIEDNVLPITDTEDITELHHLELIGNQRMELNYGLSICPRKRTCIIQQINKDQVKEKILHGRQILKKCMKPTWQASVGMMKSMIQDITTTCLNLVQAVAILPLWSGVTPPTWVTESKENMWQLVIPLLETTKANFENTCYPQSKVGKE